MTTDVAVETITHQTAIINKYERLTERLLDTVDQLTGTLAVLMQSGVADLTQGEVEQMTGGPRFLGEGD